MTATLDAALDRIRTYAAEGFARDLAALVACPSEAANPAALQGYLADLLQPRLAALGFDCRVHANPDPRGGPLMIGGSGDGPAPPPNSTGRLL